MKKFLITSVILLITALLIAVAMFWYVTNLLENPSVPAAPSNRIAVPVSTSSDLATTTQDAKVESSYELSEVDSNRLESFGVDIESITITPEMVACAESKLGSGRAEEIAAGDTPSALEVGRLLGCLGA